MMKQFYQQKANLNEMEVLIFKALINSRTSHKEFVSVNSVVKEFDDIKEEIKILKTSTINQIF